MVRSACRYAVYLAGGRLAGVMFPAPPWIMTRDLSFGWRDWILYSILYVGGSLEEADARTTCRGGALDRSWTPRRFCLISDAPGTRLARPLRDSRLQRHRPGHISKTPSRLEFLFPSPLLSPGLNTGLVAIWRGWPVPCLTSAGLEPLPAIRGRRAHRC